MKCTLYPVFAAASPRAVIYRRGPSNHTCLIAWDRSDDSFEIGHWFKGTVKPAWSGLSPNGAWLVTMLGKHRGPFGTWTVLSRPPYLTAHALWPKGDLWSGGGFFLADDTLVLAHVNGPHALAPGFALPAGLTVLPYGDETRAGIEARRPPSPWQARADGAQILRHASGHALLRRAEAPATRHPMPPSTEERTRHGLLVGGLREIALPPAGWAAFDAAGDLLFSEGGRLLRLDADRIGAITTPEDLTERARCLADFTDLRFRAVPAPPEARPQTAPETDGEAGGFLPPLDRVSREDRQRRRAMRKARERVG